MTKKVKAKGKPKHKRAKEENRNRLKEVPNNDKMIAGANGEKTFSQELDEIYGITRSSEEGESGRGQRIKLTPEESLQRMKEFSIRKEKIIAALRKSKNRSVYS